MEALECMFVTERSHGHLAPDRQVFPNRRLTARKKNTRSRVGTSTEGRPPPPVHWCRQFTVRRSHILRTNTTDRKKNKSKIV